MKRVFVFTFFLFLSVMVVTAQNAVKISLTAVDKAKYVHFMAGKNILDRLSYQSSDLDSSPVLDTVLIQKALTLGGYSPQIVVVDVPNSERERVMVVAGDIDMAGTSQWDFFCEENKDKIYASDVVIPNGAFEKGIYTTKDKASNLNVKSIKDLGGLTCVSTSNWRVDWKTLKTLGFKTLNDAPSRDTMFKMVAAGRVDLTVQSFSNNPDMSISVGDATLFPVKGVKVVLLGTRHYVISKSVPNAKAIYDALQKGLAQMKKDNEVNRALIESGFYNAAVKNWKILQ